MLFLHMHASIYFKVAHVTSLQSLVYCPGVLCVVPYSGTCVLVTQSDLCLYVGVDEENGGSSFLGFYYLEIFFMVEDMLMHNLSRDALLEVSSTYLHPVQGIQRSLKANHIHSNCAYKQMSSLQLRQ